MSKQKPLTRVTLAKGGTHKRGDVRLWNLVLDLHSPHHVNQFVLGGAILYPRRHVNPKLSLDTSLWAMAQIAKVRQMYIAIAGLKDNSS